jgi:WD40 repeat protein
MQIGFFYGSASSYNSFHSRYTGCIGVLPNGELHQAPVLGQRLPCIGNVRRVETTWPTLLSTLEGHEGQILDVAFSSDEELLASASTDGSVWIWNTDSGSLMRRLEKHTSDIRAVTFSPVDSNLLASLSVDGTAKLWVINAGTGLGWYDDFFVKQQHGPNLFKPYTNRFMFSPNGKALDSHPAEAAVIWVQGLGSKSSLRLLEGHSIPIMSIAFSQNTRRWLAAGSNDCIIRLWETKTWQHPRVLRGHNARVGAVGLSSDGMTLTSVSVDLIIKQWDPETGVTRQTIDLSVYSPWKSKASLLLLSPNQETLVSVIDDHGYIVYDVNSGSELRKMAKKDSRIKEYLQ